MKLSLRKKAIKSLSKESNIAKNVTPYIAGGNWDFSIAYTCDYGDYCLGYTHKYRCRPTDFC
ncbi:hypothetical protein ACSLBF_05470 [Pseudoalteromonas sp. T1lg65]|uniref:hypothetical protein n=1 Tax=Pseudoalteromonas sp. T1lg65 TaxID=2077101 RepID=UPI003F7AA223